MTYWLTLAFAALILFAIHAAGPVERERVYPEALAVTMPKESGALIEFPGGGCGRVQEDGSIITDSGTVCGGSDTVTMELPLPNGWPDWDIDPCAMGHESAAEAHCFDGKPDAPPGSIAL